MGAQSGTCQDQILTNRATGYKKYLCPGGNNVRCCLQ